MDIEVGQHWVRKADGVEVVVETIGGGSHAWLDVRMVKTGRLRTLSEQGLRKKYALIS